jgi:hypothetical protein
MKMTRILFVGQEPETVDFADPALPPGFNAEKIHAGIAIALRQTAERGWEADLCLVRPDKSAVSRLESQLASKAAPSASIAFNTRPEDTADAAARWVKID